MVLVEREVPLQQVAEVLARARRGKGGTLLLSGEAGIGKSALIEQVAKTSETSLRCPALPLHTTLWSVGAGRLTATLGSARPSTCSSWAR